jgi:hypothetical protein
MPEPTPTTDTGTSPKIKIPTWGYIAIGVAAIAIAYFYKKNQEKKESYFTPTQAAENRPYEPGFGGSGGASSLLEPSSPKQEPLLLENVAPLISAVSPVVPPPQVAPTPTQQETQAPNIVPNLLGNAGPPGYYLYPGTYEQAQQQAAATGVPTVVAAVPQSSATSEGAYYSYPGTAAQAQRQAEITQQPVVIQAQPQPSSPSAPYYPAAEAVVQSDFPGGIAEQRAWIKAHSHY